MTDNMSTLYKEFEAQLKSVSSRQELTQLKVEYLGKKGHVTGLMKEMKIFLMKKNLHTVRR